LERAVEIYLIYFKNILYSKHDLLVAIKSLPLPSTLNNNIYIDHDYHIKRLNQKNEKSIDHIDEHVVSIWCTVCI
jgi:hypothetical protein